QCECGAGNRPRYSKFLADGPDQGGFSCTHFSVKQHNALISGKFQKLTGAPGQFIEGIAFELEGLHGVKIRFLGQPYSLKRFGGIPGALRPPSQIKMSLRPAAPKTGKGSYSLKRFGGIPALCARPSKSTCRFVRLPQKRERGRTRSSDLGGSRRFAPALPNQHVASSGCPKNGKGVVLAQAIWGDPGRFAPALPNQNVASSGCPKNGKGVTLAHSS